METPHIEQRLGFYLDTFARVKGVVGDPQFAIAILQEVGKDSRVERMRALDSGERASSKNGNGNGSGSEPATAKQLGYLKKLGVEAKPGLTKREASALIDEHQAA